MRCLIAATACVQPSGAEAYNRRPRAVASAKWKVSTGAAADALEVAKWREQGSVRSEGSGENLTVALGASAPRLFFWVGDL